MKQKYIRWFFIIIWALLAGVIWGGCRRKEEAPASKDILTVGQEAGVCVQDIYKEASASGTLAGADTIEKFLKHLGEAGYSAVDADNQWNMTCPETMEEFCENVQKEIAGEAVLMIVMSEGQLCCCHFSFDGKQVEISQCMVNWENNEPKAGFKEEFQAVSWVYTDKGYLFFERSLPEGYEKDMGYRAIRVKPLDSRCREACRTYVAPINYYLNNMFLCDWDEKNFKQLNFYDLFEPLYRMDYGCESPYGVHTENDRYEIPEEEFEKLFFKYFQMDGETLRKRTVYQDENHVYQYRPRGIHDAAWITNIPYPEVVDCGQNSDGTLTLTVDAIWPKRMMDKAFSHKVVIRPMPDGSFQYVSNQVLSLENSVDLNWYTEREAISILTEEEENTLKDAALSLASANRDICAEIDAMNRDNYEAAVQFYDAYKEGENGQVTLYQAYKNGIFGVLTFICREGRVQSYYIGIHWNKEGIPEIYQTGSGNIVDLNLTKKGYFIYMREFTAMHGSLREYIRLKPLPEQCRELTEKYISGLSYVNYDLLLNEWKEEQAAAFLNTLVFMDIYRMQTGETPELRDGKIPAELFENVMIKAFPVSVEELRNCCGYEEGSESYPLERKCSKQFAPFGEVVDYRENDDGTLTLFVEAVWADYNTDCAYRNEIIVEPHGDGNCRYLSNRVEKRGTDRKILAGEGNIVLGENDHAGMDNYDKMEAFLEKAESGESCGAEVYEIHEDGGYSKYSFGFDGRNMSVEISIVTWDSQGPISTGNYQYEIESWFYTEKGWFSYVLDVPEPPEVSEVIQDKVMMRVRPMDERCREFTEKWLVPIGYQRNNMFSTEWDRNHMENLDFNALYESFYYLFYGEFFDSEDFPEGIPAENFEDIMLRYLPVSREKLREYGTYNEETGRYGCANLGCGNYSLAAFWTSLPETADIRENGDGTWTVTVDAVCEREGTDCILSHELTVDFPEDGRIRFLGNHLIGDGADRIPLYRYRVGASGEFPGPRICSE